MKEYVSAVAVVRSMENLLLTYNDFEQLINARNQNEFDTLLLSKNNSSLSEVWEMLKTFAPDSRELEIMLYQNDFSNLKSVLKAMISNKEPDSYFIQPSNISLETLKEAFQTKNSDILPDYMRETAETAYELLTRTLDGQLTDILIDTATLMTMQKASKDFGGEFIQKYVQLITAFADIKVAYRCSKIQVSKDFMESAVCGSDELDKQSLIRTALAGTDSFIGFLEHTSYINLAEVLKENPELFERYCDNLIMEFAEDAQMKAFGIEPLIAYFIAKETELKNIRIISVCREMGLEKKQIIERLRKSYV